MGGSVTGLGGNYLVIDDPHKVGEAGTGKEIETQIAQYRHIFSSRHDNKKLGATVIVMQRINDKDLSAHVLENDEGFVHLKLEAEATERKTITFPRSGRILTRNQGDLLWPEREGAAEIEKQKKVMGSWVYAAQYQQDPIPQSGGIFQRAWFENRFFCGTRWHSVREEGEDDCSELGHGCKEEGVQRLLGLHDMGAGCG